MRFEISRLTITTFPQNNPFPLHHNDAIDGVSAPPMCYGLNRNTARRRLALLRKTMKTRASIVKNENLPNKAIFPDSAGRLALGPGPLWHLWRTAFANCSPALTREARLHPQRPKTRLPILSLKTNHNKMQDLHDSVHVRRHHHKFFANASPSTALPVSELSLDSHGLRPDVAA